MPYQDVWIVAEQHAGQVLPIARELLQRGRSLAQQRRCRLCAMVFAAAVADEQLQELIACGADRVVAFEAPELAHFLVEPYARCMLELIRRFQPEIILAGATSTGRTLMPYVAMAAGCGLTADCTALAIDPASGNLLQTRPAIGGNIMATIQTPQHRPQMATVRPHSTPPALPQPGRRGEIIRETAPSALLHSRIQRTGFVANPANFSLADAEIVVCVGRGIKKPEALPLLQDLATALGASLGASRDVVDRGWLSYAHQIGLSGQTINPRLYIGIGVSGAIQHLAGMQSAATIVAINSDKDAPIFQVADFGIVGNLFDIVPAMIAAARRGELLYV